MMFETASTSETSVKFLPDYTAKHPEYIHLHTRRRWELNITWMSYVFKGFKQKVCEIMNYIERRKWSKVQVPMPANRMMSFVFDNPRNLLISWITVIYSWERFWTPQWVQSVICKPRRTQLHLIATCQTVHSHRVAALWFIGDWREEVDDYTW